MAYTFLQAVNDTLELLGLITTDLTTFTDSSKQVSINNVIQAWNDAIDELYRAAELPNEVATSTFTLTTGTREYSLASDAVKVIGDPICVAKKQRLTPYPGGFLQMRLDQLDPDDYEGQPNQWCISEVNTKVRIDRNPTASENGDAYAYPYEKRINLSAIADAFPFNDDVVDALKGAVCQIYNKYRRPPQFDRELYTFSMSKAAGFANPNRDKTSYGVRRSRVSFDYSSTFNP